MNKKIKKMSMEEENAFWERKDSTDYINWAKAKRAVLPKLMPSIKTISVRIPEIMLEELKLLAHKRDVPYHSLLKVFLADRIEKEIHHRRTL